MKRANLLIRKADRDGLADLGFSDEAISKLFSADFAGRVGFPDYALKNNSANIRRIEKRLADLQKTQSDVTTEEEFPGRIRLVDNVEDNRLQIFFPEVPSEPIRRELKSNGFRWSPTLGAWRKRNRLSQRGAVAVLQKHYFHITFASLRSWEEGRRSPHPHTSAILEKFLNDHPTVPPPK